QVYTTHVGQTSFTLSYKLLNPKQELVGTAKTVHVTVDKTTKNKISLPKDMRGKIQELYKQDNK
ncbi:MAG: hypothetical protein Q7S13_04255, partial [Candidatus Omnitrophota bacterium]|nr:hypothetical protein [Candidatus Omnitrophota bacterium]